MPIAKVESLDHDGRGVAHVDGKAIFIEGALPGELVEYASYRRKPKYENASTIASNSRVEPERGSALSPFWSRCGGCSMQHSGSVGTNGRQAAGARGCALAYCPYPRRSDTPAHFGTALEVSAACPIVGAHGSHAKAAALVGFRERHSSFVAVDGLLRDPAREGFGVLIPELKSPDWRDVPDRIDCLRSRWQ
jgi:23S rRNA (uracil1939-C5)-methyltransferase